MKTNEWFKDLLNSLKDTFEFRFEALILKITETICEKMKLKNINRAELAGRLNVSSPAVTKILNGNSNFTLKTMLSLADALDLELVVDFKEQNEYVNIQEYPNISYSLTTVESYLTNSDICCVSEISTSYMVEVPFLTKASLVTESQTAGKVPRLLMAA